MEERVEVTFTWPHVSRNNTKTDLCCPGWTKPDDDRDNCYFLFSINAHKVNNKKGCISVLFGSYGDKVDEKTRMIIIKRVNPLIRAGKFYPLRLPKRKTNQLSIDFLFDLKDSDYFPEITISRMMDIIKIFGLESIGEAWIHFIIYVKSQNKWIDLRDYLKQKTGYNGFICG